MKNKLTYSSWLNMKQRCDNPKSAAYTNYGAKGITYSEEWGLFTNFLRDMGERPSQLFTLDRINNTKNYSPDNCRWATRHEQARNTSRNKYYTFKGKRMVLKDIVAEHSRVCYSTVCKRLQQGCSLDRAMERATNIRGRYKGNIMIQVTEEEFRDHDRDYDGACTNCNEIQYGGCEPDARNYHCESCGKYRVYGFSELLIMGKIELIEEQ